MSTNLTNVDNRGKLFPALRFKQQAQQVCTFGPVEEPEIFTAFAKTLSHATGPLTTYLLPLTKLVILHFSVIPES